VSEWVSGCVVERVGGWVSGCVGERLSGWVGGCVSKQVSKGFFQSSSFWWSLLEGRCHYLFFVLALRKIMMRLIGITFSQKTHKRRFS